MPQPNPEAEAQNEKTKTEFEKGGKGRQDFLRKLGFECKSIYLQLLTTNRTKILDEIFLITMLTSFLFYRISKKANSASDEPKHFAPLIEQRHKSATHPYPVI